MCCCVCMDSVCFNLLFGWSVRGTVAFCMCTELKRSAELPFQVELLSVPIKNTLCLKASVCVFVAEWDVALRVQALLQADACLNLY